MDENEKDELEFTRVDLGDDLIEKTALTGMPVPPDPPGFDPTNAFESAKILNSEGLIEEAKAVLYRLIRTDSHHLPARDLLKEIHEQELKQIFSEGGAPRRRYGGNRERPAADEAPDDVMRRLDHDLQLGVFEDDQEILSPLSELSLFQDRDALNDFAARIDRDLSSASPRERLDLGVAFMEMGLLELALRQFRAVQSAVFRDGGADREMVLSAAVLTATALIRSGKPFDAISVIEQVVWDSDLKDEDKVELLYLLGTAYERAGKKKSAAQWFAEVARIDARYRDVRDKLR